MIYSDGEHNSNKAIHSELLNLAEYNVHVAKLVNAGQNRTATRVCNPLLQILVTPDAELVSLSSIISWSHWQSYVQDLGLLNLHRSFFGLPLLLPLLLQVTRVL